MLVFRPLKTRFMFATASAASPDAPFGQHVRPLLRPEHGQEEVGFPAGGWVSAQRSKLLAQVGVRNWDFWVLFLLSHALDHSATALP